jgi:hypothetical protein
MAHPASPDLLALSGASGKNGWRVVQGLSALAMLRSQGEAPVSLSVWLQGKPQASPG